jgi:hypothetical protein
MQSNRFLEIAEKIFERDKAIFDTLIEFEQSKRIRTKEHIDFTIDKAIASRFRKYCRENGCNMSAKVEQAIRVML